MQRVGRVLLVVGLLVLGIQQAMRRDGGGERAARDQPRAARVVPPKVETEKPAFEPAPAGSPFDERAISRFAIYALPTPRVDPRRAVAEVVRGRFAYLRVVAEKDDGPLPLVLVTEPAIAGFAPPKGEDLTYFGRGLSDEQGAAVQGSKHALLMEFVGSGDDRWRVGRDGMAVAAQVAERTGGLLWDEETRLLYSPQAWAERSATWSKERPLARKLFEIHSYQDGELLRMVTIGLGKLGLPDLVVNQVSRSDDESMARLINLTAQTMVEGGQVGPGGQLAVDVKAVQGTYEVVEKGTGKAVVTLAVAERADGDANNRLWELRFPEPAAQGLQERHSLFLAGLFGSHDAVTMVANDDAELIAASDRARRRLLAAKPSLQPIPPMTQLSVKAPFRTDDGGTEWMWVTVTEWRGTTMSGLLDNDPFYVKGLVAGARVEVAEDSIYDYLLTRADGSKEGGQTVEILLRREGK